ncbi:MAG: hypothetical protein QOD75_1193 [Blastocatellia bacterium]|jgi:hypothetical protein|nr:hypothetical protein [Blastocatellia bacterium]
MITPNLLDDSAIADDERANTRNRVLVGVLCAIVLTASVSGGYLYLRKRHARETAARVLAEAKQGKVAIPPKAQVFVDEAMPQGTQIIIGGAVQNISSERLNDVSVAINLRKRKDGGTEIKVVPLDPRDLNPGEQGRYMLLITAKDYSLANVMGLKSGSLLAEIPFKQLPGAERPPMKTPEGKTIVVGRPRGKGEEFLNTPDNPAKIP